MQTQTNYNSNHAQDIEKNDVRQGRRVKGMPTVLAISTTVVIVAFVTMLVASLA